jgi:hypothetical protein
MIARISYNTYHCLYERFWQDTGSGPGLQFEYPIPSLNVAGSDVPGLAQSVEGLGFCDTTPAQIEVCSSRN